MKKIVLKKFISIILLFCMIIILVPQSLVYGESNSKEVNNKVTKKENYELWAKKFQSITLDDSLIRVGKRTKISIKMKDYQDVGSINLTYKNYISNIKMYVKLYYNKISGNFEGYTNYMENTGVFLVQNLQIYDKSRSLIISLNENQVNNNTSIDFYYDAKIEVFDKIPNIEFFNLSKNEINDISNELNSQIEIEMALDDSTNIQKIVLSYSEYVDEEDVGEVVLSKIGNKFVGKYNMRKSNLNKLHHIYIFTKDSDSVDSNENVIQINRKDFNKYNLDYSDCDINVKSINSEEETKIQYAEQIKSINISNTLIKINNTNKISVGLKNSDNIGKIVVTYLDKYYEESYGNIIQVDLSYNKNTDKFEGVTDVLKNERYYEFSKIYIYDNRNNLITYLDKNKISKYTNLNTQNLNFKVQKYLLYFKYFDVTKYIEAKYCKEGQIEVVLKNDDNMHSLYLKYENCDLHLSKDFKTRIYSVEYNEKNDPGKLLGIYLNDKVYLKRDDFESLNLDCRDCDIISNVNNNETNEDIISLQKALNTSYRTNLKKDGIYGNKTKKVVKIHYLKKGKKNAHVTWLQQSLKDLGYDIKVDGIYGKKTVVIVKQFQKNNGLNIDGYAGLNTHNKIISKLI